MLIVRNDGGCRDSAREHRDVTDTLPADVTATKITAEGEGANGDRLAEV